MPMQKSTLLLLQAALFATGLVLLTSCAGPGASGTGGIDPGLSQSATLASVCSGCHGGDVASEGIVSLNGYSATRIAVLFRKYKNEAEGPTAMHRMARGYTDVQIKQIARYLAKGTP